MQVCSFCKEPNPDDAAVCRVCGRSLRPEEQEWAERLITSAHLVPGVVLAGRYELIEKVGQGGFGIVFKARDKKLHDRVVALKVLPPELASDERAIEDLKTEAEVAMALSHPNLMRLYNFEESGGICFLVMEFLEGPTLSQILAKRKRLTPDETIALSKQICDGLAYAHSQKVIHRDLKPGNLMLTNPVDPLVQHLDAPEVQLKITDFGIARKVKDTMTRVSNRPTTGTLSYMSPEQLRGKAVDARSDIYSLGCVLYELLSGRPPFHTGDIYSQHLHESPEPLKEVATQLNSAILQCLEKNPAARWQNADDLKLALEGKVAARPTPKPEPVEARRRKGKGLIFASVGVVLVAAAAIIAYHTLIPQPQPAPAPTVTPAKIAALKPTPTITSAAQPSPKPMPTLSPTPLSSPTAEPTHTPLPTATALSKQIPIVSWVEVPPKSLAWGEHKNIEIRYEGKHPAGGIDHYEYRLNEGEWKSTKLARITLQELSPGDNKIELVAVDPDGERSLPLIHEIKVLNKPPTIEWVKAPGQGATVRMPPSFSLEVKASDEDGKIAGYYFSLDTPRAPQKQPEPSFELKDLAEGEHTIYAFAQDDAGERSEQISRRFKVERNLAPTVRIASIPEKIKEGENLLARVEGQDPDGKITAYSYRLNTWSDWKQTSSSEITITALVPGNYTLHVYAIDNDSCLSKEIDSQFQIERNLAPTVRIASIPDKIMEGENLIVHVQGQDPDGKIAGYAYKLNTWSNWKQTSSSEITIAGLVPGNYTLHVYAIDNDSCPSKEIERRLQVIDKKMNERLPSGLIANPGTPPEPYTNTGLPREIIHEKTGIEMVFIPAGTFQMGSPSSEQGRDNEGPVHTVRISKPFYLGKYELTQGQWQAIMGSNPSYFKGSEQLPVEQVSWDDCQEFLKRLGEGFRLPSEAEWEYACRAGTQTRYYFGDNESDLVNYAWYHANSGRKTHPVGQKGPNAWGLYDMHGNVREWCQDWYHDSYEGAPTDGRAWESPEGKSRVLRGGSWYFTSDSCRSATRSRDQAHNRFEEAGLRLLWTP